MCGRARGLRVHRRFPAGSEPGERRRSCNLGAPASLPARRFDLADNTRLEASAVRRSVLMRHTRRVLPVVEKVRDDFMHAHPVLHLCEDERPAAAHLLRVARHHVEVRADSRCEIRFIDHEQIRLRMPGPPLRAILLPPPPSCRNRFRFITVITPARTTAPAACPETAARPCFTSPTPDRGCCKAKVHSGDEA